MELWLKIGEFPNYEISSNGRVRNSKTSRILKTNVNERGYDCVCLHDKGRQYNKRVHRLVADTFYDGDHQGLDVNHRDGDKLNNHISNLEFCTRSENVQHAFNNGLKKPSRQIKIRIVETGEVFNSIRECGRALGCNQSDICKCLNGGQKTCAGYHFEKI